MASTGYTKPYLSIEEQIQLISSRGMTISNRDAAAACLRRIGYYRLSGYWYPFRESSYQDAADGKTRKFIVKDTFRAGTHFRHVMDLYVFDKRLRMLFLDAIERVEVALRVEIALMLGLQGMHAHRNPALFDRSFTAANSVGQSAYGKWLSKIDDSYQRSREEFVTHFRSKHPDEFLPVWIAIELWDFGTLSMLISGLKYADKVSLASRFGFPRPQLLTAFIRNLNNIRNICAHHGRLWNRSPADRLSPPGPREIALLEHLEGDTRAQSRVYATAAYLQFMLRKINPGSSWSIRLRAHVKSFPAGNGVSISQAGFPANWEKLDLWQ